ncbi:oligopeptide/dipeptide ABC transporter ATP-binding protein [Marinobacter sp. SS13-12]|uniref:oligopeptide/dipeptide ABC transporter ATP-binding protein n=1 Tax=Marinobacter sp. SS13-12 TaxID=3050451 RepID=UPI0025559F48|nr:oligopeptide/dipeptide ABC transporter ATP-binding protein [Marinobacter sp. SS13-12]MDK8464602.1 ATP-binding cassette domain-containing protein [Marinobacter sp. SS13-12]
MAMLEVNNLKVDFDTPDGTLQAVRGLSYHLEAGQTLGIVGESGAGKSQGVFALMGLLPDNARVSGEVLFEGEQLLGLSEKRMNRIRAARIGMIFQDPMTSLNPFMKVSDQLTEVLVQHKGISRKQALRESLQMLDAVRIPEARNRIHRYPHEFSGGMRQRVMIAMSLLCRPQLLIADEPTTALDVTVQAQVMGLLRELQQEFNTAIILITHDLGVVAGSCDQTLVMYGGQMMEYAATRDLFRDPTHPYTIGLMGAIPRIDEQIDELVTIPGNPPNLMNLPPGCPFFSRCPVAEPRCYHELDRPEHFEPDRIRVCNLPREAVR